jgi:hypothetical protein
VTFFTPVQLPGDFDAISSERSPESFPAILEAVTTAAFPFIGASEGLHCRFDIGLYFSFSNTFENYHIVIPLGQLSTCDRTVGSPAFLCETACNALRCCSWH